MTTSNKTTGRVFLVGAGPGDPGLITLRGIDCLSRADLVLYDYLVNPAILEHAPPHAELICRGGPDSESALSPDEIYARMVNAGRDGQIVVHLKGGDPSIFGRGADEVAVLRSAGIPFEIVPGITTGLAAAAYCEIPITHHDDASAVAFITGRERDAKAYSHLDFAALAAFPGTLVFYMGVRRARSWSCALMEHGKPADTPVAVIQCCSTARQRTTRSTLGSVAAVIEQRHLGPPAIIIVGSVVEHAPAMAWFESRPLFGLRVLVGECSGIGRDIRNQLDRLGADVTSQTLLRVTEPLDWRPVDSALTSLRNYEWLICTTADEVEFFFRRLFAIGGDVRRLAHLKIAVSGAEADQRLQQFGLRPDLVISASETESSSAMLAREIMNARVLVTKTHGRRPAFDYALRSITSTRDAIVVCRRVADGEADPMIRQAVADREFDWIVVPDVEVANALIRMYGQALFGARVITLDRHAAAVLRESGSESVVQASSADVSSIVSEMLESIHSNDDAVMSAQMYAESAEAPASVAISDMQGHY